MMNELVKKPRLKKHLCVERTPLNLAKKTRRLQEIEYWKEAYGFNIITRSTIKKTIRHVLLTDPKTTNVWYTLCLGCNKRKLVKFRPFPTQFQKGIQYWREYWKVSQFNMILRKSIEQKALELGFLNNNKDGVGAAKVITNLI